jgi:hypothetical protein
MALSDTFYNLDNDPRSPATDDYMSPTFSYNSLEESIEEEDTLGIGGEEGYTYDAVAAREQASRLKQRRMEAEIKT